MNRQANSVLSSSDDLPIRTSSKVHSGKVRSVYFLTPEDSRRLIAQRGYAIHPESELAVMVISDRLSAFDCLWRSRSLQGVPGKGAALNAIAAHWFRSFDGAGLMSHHLLESPHPMLWVVRQARPVKIEAIARRYLTGSLWRAYAQGERRVGGVELPEGMQRYARFDELLFTPSTKGVIRGVEGVPETDDAPVDPSIVRSHAEHFALPDSGALEALVVALEGGFELIEAALAKRGELLVDTKFEFGVAPGLSGQSELIYMDEVGTPDSSRIWRRDDWQAGRPREYSKEQFREALLNWVPDRQLLLDAKRMSERAAFAREASLPDAMFEELASTYRNQAESITGNSLTVSDRPREEMLDVVSGELGLVI
ncbi:MAG: phosphoribosylaminoimidazolesuccinocarboxamide synthase [Congregibacter sp.]